MSFSGLLRRNLFWTVDKLRGAKKTKHYNYLKKSHSNSKLCYEPEKQQKLDAILKHAVKSTRQYKSFDGYESLNDFPTIPKEYIITNYQDFVSDIYDTEGLRIQRTSGSYGTPFAIHFTPEKSVSQLMEVLYYNEQAGYRLGEPFLQLRVHHKSKLSLFLQNSTMLRPEKISEQWLESARQVLLNKKYHFLITYPASLIPVAAYCKEKGDTPDRFGIKNMVTSAEILTDNARRLFTSVFGAKIHDRYATLETGILAHECPECGYYHVNFPDYHIELLRFDRPEPVAPGELGRVVVTDFNSMAVPLIRYDIGDVSEWVQPGESCKPNVPTLKKIVGRKDDYVVNDQGEMISPVVIFEAVALEDSLCIVQYQFIQYDRSDYVMKLVTAQGYQYEALLKTRLLDKLGKSANIRFEYVEDIPPLASGKRQVIINRYTPSTMHHN